MSLSTALFVLAVIAIVVVAYLRSLHANRRATSQMEWSRSAADLKLALEQSTLKLRERDLDLRQQDSVASAAHRAEDLRLRQAEHLARREDVVESRALARLAASQAAALNLRKLAEADFKLKQMGVPIPSFTGPTEFFSPELQAEGFVSSDAAGVDVKELGSVDVTLALDEGSLELQAVPELELVFATCVSHDGRRIKLAPHPLPAGSDMFDVFEAIMPVADRALAA